MTSLEKTDSSQLPPLSGFADYWFATSKPKKGFTKGTLSGRIILTLELKGYLLVSLFPRLERHSVDNWTGFPEPKTTFIEYQYTH